LAWIAGEFSGSLSSYRTLSGSEGMQAPIRDFGRELSSEES